VAWDQVEVAVLGSRVAHVEAATRVAAAWDARSVTGEVN